MGLWILIVQQREISADLVDFQRKYLSTLLSGLGNSTERETDRYTDRRTNRNSASAFIFYVSFTVHFTIQYLKNKQNAFHFHNNMC
jgi:hypothetical protein